MRYKQIHKRALLLKENAPTTGMGMATQLGLNSIYACHIPNIVQNALVPDHIGECGRGHESALAHNQLGHTVTSSHLQQRQIKQCKQR